MTGRNLFPAAILICIFLFIGGAFVSLDFKEKLPALETAGSTQSVLSEPCKNECKSSGGESLPRGIVTRTSDLEMQSLGGSPRSLKKKGKTTQKSLLAIAVGVKQKKVVNQIVQKFSSNNFVIMLFHYDGIVDGWKDMPWSGSALHVSAINQTKWWFAKRFLHPDIVTEYKYIFLWDEDLGVDHFHPGRYLSIIEKEGLEISQPALDTSKSQVHHRITARWRKGNVHRRIYNYHGGGQSCDENSIYPPCTGWVEMMAPVFSRAAWHCVWYMIQNDLIHAWGLDMQLGYCAQGDRSKNVGVVDSEYIVHKAIPTLGSYDDEKATGETSNNLTQIKTEKSKAEVRAGSHASSDRSAVRYRSYRELEIFRRRWNQAVEEDKCWIDPYRKPKKKANNN
ncbi:hypothetical protein IHE45_04G001100 [Dioscorea alata]|nr:hypothetical protein IHE45_04G001100 [Dioscorea alata]